MKSISWISYFSSSVNYIQTTIFPLMKEKRLVIKIDKIKW